MGGAAGGGGGGARLNRQGTAAAAAAPATDDAGSAVEMPAAASDDSGAPGNGIAWGGSGGAATATTTATAADAEPLLAGALNTGAMVGRRAARAAAAAECAAAKHRGRRGYRRRGRGSSRELVGRAVAKTERVVRVRGVAVGRGMAWVGGHRWGRDRQREATAPTDTGWRWWPHRGRAAYRRSNLPRAAHLVGPWRSGNGRRSLPVWSALKLYTLEFPHSIGYSIRLLHAIGQCVMPASAYFFASLSVSLNRYASSVSNN